MRQYSALSIVALAAMSACSTTSDQSPDYGPRVAVFHADTASTLLLSSFSGFRTPMNLVVTDAATWAEVWSEAQGSLEPPEPAPGVDFGEDAVIVAALGTAPNSGYGLSIDSVEFFAGNQKVWLTRSAPDASCATLTVITHPVHIIRAPRPLNQVTFEERTRTFSCGR